MSYLTQTLTYLGKHSGEWSQADSNPHSLIDDTLREIGETYRAGLLGVIKADTQRWAKMLSIEAEINRAALSGDREGLRKALEAYKSMFLKAKDIGRQEKLF